MTPNLILAGPLQIVLVSPQFGFVQLCHLLFREKYCVVQALNEHNKPFHSCVPKVWCNVPQLILRWPNKGAKNLTVPKDNWHTYEMVGVVLPSCTKEVGKKKVRDLPSPSDYEDDMNDAVNDVVNDKENGKHFHF